MISVLLPSRKRAKLAQDCITTLNLKDNDAEVILSVDADDPELEEYRKIKGVQFQVGMRYGYHQLHAYYNKMSTTAQGDWLMVYNDDAMMMTPDWASKITQDPTKPLCLNVYDPGNPLNNLFPLISRKWYDTVKHYSLSPHNDSWVQDIANELKIHQGVEGIEIKHIRDMLLDETKFETQGAYATTSPLHNSPEMVALRNQDRELLRAEL